MDDQSFQVAMDKIAYYYFLIFDVSNDLFIKYDYSYDAFLNAFNGYYYPNALYDMTEMIISYSIYKAVDRCITRQCW